MILVAGGTGNLGTEVVRRLRVRQLAVRVLTRAPERARHLAGEGVEIVVGDVRDGRSLARAMGGARTVVSAMHGFAGIDAAGVKAVDRDGNANLIRAARASGVEHFVLLSIHGAASSHAMELFRAKHAAERALEQSGLAWTILRPTAYMETWLMVMGEPLQRGGKIVVFGRGENPINFVSVRDVAAFVERAVLDSSMRGRALDVGGPENLTFNEFARRIERAAGRANITRHVPRAVMRVVSTLLAPVKPRLAGQIRGGVVMDTADMSYDASPRLREFPSLPLTSLDQIIAGKIRPA
ncbi:MAG TPA: SDR family oxidoreductase [Gemmatimonadaceae bacterium]|nr:SDR family oxidoreductase [Gemmatimonadaceae bacterium]